MIHDAQHRGAVHALGGLRQIGIIHQIEFLSGDRLHNLRRAQAETLQHEGRLRRRFALGGGNNVKPPLGIQVGGGNGGNDAVGIRMLVTKNIGGHDGSFSAARRQRYG